MNSSPEPIKNPLDDLTRSGIKFYSIALRMSAVGCISAFVLALLAILTLFFERGDTSGPGFFIFGILAICVLVVSGAVAIFMSLVGIAHGITTLTENRKLTEEVTNAITKNIGLILGVIVVIAIVFKLLKNW